MGSGHRRSRRAPTRLVGVGSLVAAGLAAGGLLAGCEPGDAGEPADDHRGAIAGSTRGGASDDAARPAGDGEQARPGRRRAAAAAGVLRDWDTRRARAWADGDPARLRSLYVAGSRAGARDRRMLSHWVSRGWQVHGMSTQLLAVRVVRRGRAALVVRVTDRVVGGVAVPLAAADGREPRSLPRDRASVRRVRLRRVRGEWRVASVLTLADAVRPGRGTARRRRRPGRRRR